MRSIQPGRYVDADRDDALLGIRYRLRAEDVLVHGVLPRQGAGVVVCSGVGPGGVGVGVGVARPDSMAVA